MSEQRSLVILGASARAAAFSAIRSGFAPICFDLFADRDLRYQAKVHLIPRSDYPHCLGRHILEAPIAPWMYTGGLENWPALIETVAAQRPLWGCGGEGLRRVRSHEMLHEFLKQGGFATPRVLWTPPSRSTHDDIWLCKPRRSAGGRGISIWDGRPITGQEYLQRFVPGESFAAIYCASHRGVELLGVTEQLVGEPWLNAKPFAYCGSVGPVSLPDADRTELDRLGKAIAEWGELRGLFGVDLVKHDGHYHVIEVNPRYTASIEVLESATGRFFVRHHAAAFESDSNQVTPAQPPASIVGKAILFASRRMTFPVEGPWDEDIRRDVHEFRHYADVPTPGSVIEPGWPILTILVQGHLPTEVRRLLYERALVTQRLLESVR